MSNLKTLRESRNLTQAQLAALSGIHPKKVSKIESGEIQLANITLETAVKLARALGVHAEDLIA